MTVSGEFWRGKRVFLTGHTGFKGAWLALWLHELGAKVTGFALPPEDEHYLFSACGVEHLIHSRIGDIRNAAQLSEAINAAAPEVIFHLAAQSLVRRSYRLPVETFETNVMGTINLLEAARKCDTVRSIVVVTSDKCYENRDLNSPPYTEEDPLGGSDPYSASKACTELAARAYREAWMSGGDARTVMATVRAGNVIGGGDYAEDRIVPDAIRALGQGDILRVRNPHAIRPWQHVLEPLAGYLMLAEKLHVEGDRWGGAWNFGPRHDAATPVAALADLIVKAWGGAASWSTVPLTDGLHEARRLELDSGKARRLLGWQPKLSLSEAVSMSVQWYREASSSDAARLRDFSVDQIRHYEGLLVTS